MQLIHFPAARIIEINAFILSTEPSMRQPSHKPMHSPMLINAQV